MVRVIEALVALFSAPFPAFLAGLILGALAVLAVVES